MTSPLLLKVKMDPKSPGSHPPNGRVNSRDTKETVETIPVGLLERTEPEIVISGRGLLSF